MPRGLRRESAAARLLGLWVRIPPGGHRYLFLLSVLCYQVQVSATGRSLVQRSLTECGISVCNCETSIRGRVSCARGGVWGGYEGDENISV